jgi:hypothetical protein
MRYRASREREKGLPPPSDALRQRQEEEFGERSPEPAAG